MKILAPLLACLLLGAATAPAAAPVTHHDAWTEDYPVSGTAPRLDISNIWGSVTVRPGAPGVIRVSVVEERSAPDRALFDRSLDLLRLDVRADAAGVSLVVGERERAGLQSRHCRDCRVDYQFTVEVPADAIVDVSTVMDGKVDVQGIGGDVSASNVNGPVAIAGIRNCKSVSSVNGRVDLAFAQAPVSNCDIETVNGDITISIPDSAGVDVALDLFNGEVVSQLPIDTFSLPATIEQSVEDGRSIYRIQQLSGLRVGAGGPVYKVASMNGDLRITAHR